MNRKLYLYFMVGLVAALCTGCGTSQQTLKMDDNFKMSSEHKIIVGTITNEAGKDFGDVDVINLFKEAITERLDENKFLADGTSQNLLILNTKITEYDQGNAFHRWLLPGVGSTVMAVNCDLKESKTGKLVGSLDARRTVSMGGAFSIGAWKTIIGNIADDLIAKINEEISQNK